MSIILKPSALKVKDDNGNYIGTNMFAAESTQEYLDAIETIGTQTQTAISTASTQAQAAMEVKAEQTIESIPEDYTELAGDVSELKADLLQIDEDLEDVYTGKEITEYTVNKLNPDEIEYGYVLNLDGTISENANYNASGYIEIPDGKAYFVLTARSSSGYQIATNLHRVIVYNSNKTKLTDITANTDKTYTIPTGAVYLRFDKASNAWNDTHMAEFVDDIGDISTTFVPYEEVVSQSHGINYLDETQQDILERLTVVEDGIGDIGELQETVDDLVGSRTEVFSTSGSNYKANYYVNAEGTEVSNNSWGVFSTELGSTTSIIYSHLTASYSSNPKWVFFDEENEVVQSFSPVNSSDDTEISVPEGSVLLRASVANADNANATIALCKSRKYADTTELEQLNERVSDVTTELHGLRQEVYTPSGSNFKENYYINNSGAEVSSSSWNIFSLATNGETSIIYSHLTSSYSGKPKWVFFDSHGDVIEAISPVNSTEDTVLPIPDTAVLLRASISNTDKTGAKIALYIENKFPSKSEVITEINATITPVKEKIGYSVIPLIHGAYIGTYFGSNIVPYADLEHPTENSGWYYQKIACSEGDYFVVSGSGGDGARLWGFFDTDGKCLMTSDRSESASNLMIQAPISAAWLVVNSTVDASVTSANVFDAINDKPKVEFINDIGVSWEWWINCHYTDLYGNLYIGFIDKEKFVGVLCRKTDGTVVYKRKLFQSYTADDHSACSVNMLSDGRLVVMATQGHTGDYRHFALAQKPYTINCDFDIKIININPPEGHKYSFSYSQGFIDANDVIYNFFRISGYTIATPDNINDGRGWGYIKSEDYGQTWSLYRFFSKDSEYQTDPYLSVKDVDGEDTLKRILVQNTSELLGGNVIYAGFVDLADGTIYDNDMVSVGSSSEVPDVVTVDTTAVATNYVFDGTPIFMAASNLTPVVTTPTTAGQRRRIRILNVAKTGDNILAFVYGKAKDEAYTFEYRLYYDGNDIVLTDVGLNYYKSYIPGADLTFDGKTVFCSVNVALVRDGRHAIHKIITDGTRVISDDVIKISDRLLAKPVVSDNGVLSVLSGRYNEPNDLPTDYDKWEFLPVFLNV